VLLADLVAASEQVAAVPARLAKIEVLAGVLRGLDPAEVVAATAFLAGQPWQGKVGVGWAAAYKTEVAPAAEPSLTILDLDGAIEQIRTTTGPGSSEARAKIIGALFKRATAAEAAFIRRLLTGEVRQGALEGVVAEAVARAAGVPSTLVRRAAMLSGNLPATAATALAGGEEALRAVSLAVLRPVQPMLASTAPGVTAAVADLGLSSVEWKLDGARIQAHRQGDEVRLYTRNLNDVTGRLPEVCAIVAALPVESIVLDGEVIGAGDEGPLLFQDTMSRFGRDQPSATTMRPYFFDCMHLDGVDLLERPLHERLAALDRVAGAHRIPGVVTADPIEAERVLDDALAAGHEGVMVKGASSPYEAGRRGKAWRKVKPVRTFDLVVLAAEWGHGRRRGWLSNIHLGARHGDEFVMVGKTFKGLTDELLRWQTDAFQARATGSEGIVVHVRPDLVVEIALDGVQVSPRYPGGIALRFARVLRYRPDKEPHEADTLDSLRALLTRS
jgi:DNA ligase-1